MEKYRNRISSASGYFATARFSASRPRNESSRGKEISNSPSHLSSQVEQRQDSRALLCASSYLKSSPSKYSVSKASTRALRLQPESSSSTLPRTESNSFVDKGRTAGCRFRVVKPFFVDAGGYSSCIATVAEVDYHKACLAAEKRGYNAAKDSFSMKGVQETLTSLGVRSNLNSNLVDWNNLSNLAILNVRLVYPSGFLTDTRPVVFERLSNGKEYIYDNWNSKPLQRHPVNEKAPYSYKLEKNSSWLEICK